MPHFVTYKKDDGKDGYRICAQLDDAIREAERLRNSDPLLGELKLWKAEEIVVKFRTYYMVEVEEAEGGQAEKISEASVASTAVDFQAVEQTDVAEQSHASVGNSSDEAGENEGVPSVPVEPALSSVDRSAETEQDSAAFGIFSRP